MSEGNKEAGSRRTNGGKPNDSFPTQSSRPRSARAMGGLGHKERFPRPSRTAVVGFESGPLLLMIRALKLLAESLAQKPTP